jgi:hypothetical protein
LRRILSICRGLGRLSARPTGGRFSNFELLKVGKIHLLSASVGAWAMLLAAHWLIGQESPRE